MQRTLLFLPLTVLALFGCASPTPVLEAGNGPGSPAVSKVESLADALKICESQVGAEQVRPAVLYAADLLLTDLRESDLYDGPSYFYPIFRMETEFVELVDAFPWIKEERRKEIVSMRWICRKVGLEQPRREK